MSFRTNDSQQLSFSDTLYGLTPREQKALQNSWAKVFAEDMMNSVSACFIPTRLPDLILR